MSNVVGMDCKAAPWCWLPPVHRATKEYFCQRCWRTWRVASHAVEGRRQYYWKAAPRELALATWLNTYVKPAPTVVPCYGKRRTG